MPEHVFTVCHGCGTLARGKHYACPECGSQHIRQQDISWLHVDDHGATFHPTAEKAG